MNNREIKGYPGWNRTRGYCPMCHASAVNIRRPTSEILIMDPDFAPQPTGDGLEIFDRVPYVIAFGQFTGLELHTTVHWCQECGHVWLQELGRVEHPEVR